MMGVNEVARAGVIQCGTLRQWYFLNILAILLTVVSLCTL
jgi:hypothetical protein